MGSLSYTKLKVGIISILALVILFGGTSWIKQYKPMTKKVKITVLFTDAKGITTGDPVTMSGVKIGEVTNINLNSDNKALVEFYNFKGVSLSSDCAFIIKDVGLMGDKMLVVIPGLDNSDIDINKIQVGTKYTDLSDLVDGAHDVITKLNRISSRLDKDLDIAKLTRSFEQTFDKFNQAITVYEEIARDTHEPIVKSIKSFEASANEMRQFLKKNDNRFERAVESFQKTSEKISLAFDSIEKFSTIVDTLSAYMESGEGTLAKLVKTDELHEELRRTSASIDSFITDFKLNPGKYTKDMKFKIRLF